MKKYKLSIRVRKGMEEREIETEELDLTHFTESLRIKDLSIFDREAYLTFCLEELPEPEEVGN